MIPEAMPGQIAKKHELRTKGFMLFCRYIVKEQSFHVFKKQVPGDSSISIDIQVCGRAGT